MNRSTRDCLLQLLKKPEDKRKESEIAALIPILTWRIGCLKGLDKGVVVEVLRLACYQRFKKDQVIYLPNTALNRFSIILQGSVTLYSSGDTQQEPETHIHDEILRMCCSSPLPFVVSPTHKYPQEKRVRFENINAELSNTCRSRFGEEVKVLGTFKAFGDEPLLPEIFCCQPFAVVADEDTILLVVPQEKFLERLKCYEEREQEQKKLFVRTHPFFSRWPDPMHEQLIEALTRSYHPLGSTITKQGDPVTGLHFIIRGRARLSTMPIKHRKQFPELYFTADHFRETPTPERELLPPVLLTRLKDNGHMAKSTFFRRSHGYAAMERLAFDRNLELCFVEEGEILCDTELLLGIDTNIFTVTSSIACDVYTLNHKNYDKFIIKKHPQTLNLIKMIVETKLLARKSTIPGKKLDILPALLNRIRFVRIVNSELTEEQITKEKEKPVKKRPHLQANLPTKKSTNELVVEWYKADKAPLITPFTEGAVYYKEMMQKRAQERAMLRKEFPEDSVVCKAISSRVREAIVSSVRESVKCDKMVRKIQLRWSKKRLSNTWR